MRSAPDIDPSEDISTATLILTNTIKRELRERAAKEGRSQSEIARQAIAAYLRRYADAPEDSTARDKPI